MKLLDELVVSARNRAEKLPFSGDEFAPHLRSFRDALLVDGRLAVIAEMKRRSPSRSSFRSNLSFAERAQVYEAQGARAISVLTEPSKFGGCLEDLTEVAGACALPVLMKDFVVDVRQVEAARRAGASAVLLIVRILSESELVELLHACEKVGLDALVECHSEAELAVAVKSGARIVGVNNRDLDTLAIDRSRARRLLQSPLDGIVRVAESGYSQSKDLEGLRGVADAVLIGGALMDASNVGALVAELVG